MSELGDRIEIRDLELLLHCGVLEEEQWRRQPFMFDLDVYLDLLTAGTSDDLRETVDYAVMVDTLSTKLAGERFQLLERLAERTAELLLNSGPLDAVTVTVHKVRPPLSAHVSSTGVRIHRTA